VETTFMVMYGFSVKLRLCRRTKLWPDNFSHHSV